jgi:hypothetical protein
MTEPSDDELEKMLERWHDFVALHFTEGGPASKEWQTIETAAREGLASRTAGGWRFDMENAPKDDFVLLVNKAGERATARWRTAEGSNNPILHALAENGAWIVYGSAFPFRNPIGWMRLPDPPRLLDETEG